jgi:hypothetical protein
LQIPSAQQSGSFPAKIPSSLNILANVHPRRGQDVKDVSTSEFIPFSGSLKVVHESNNDKMQLIYNKCNRTSKFQEAPTHHIQNTRPRIA